MAASLLDYWIARRGTTRKDVAKKARLSYNQLGRYARGEIVFWPTARATRGVLRALDLTLDELIKGPGKVIEFTPGGKEARPSYQHKELSGSSSRQG